MNYARHAITWLPVPMREHVQDAIYRALKEFAEGGNHGIDPYQGPIPIQDIYLRKVVGSQNKVIGVAHKALEDPARGCNMKKT